MKFLCKQKEIPSQYTKWMTPQFTVEYREGKTNKTADALSRVQRQEEAVIYSLEVSMAYVLSNINSEIKKGSTTDKITQ